MTSKKKRNLLALFTLCNLAFSTFANEEIVFKPYNNFQKSEETKKREEYEWMFNPLSKVVTKDQWDQITEEMEKERQIKEDNARRFGQAKVITIDTRDQKSCNRIKEELLNTSSIDMESIENLCSKDDKNPYVSVIAPTSYETKGIVFSELSTEQQNIVKQTRNFTVLGAGMVGLLWMMPESVTKWDKDEIGGLGDKYFENIKAGPVVDKDDWAVNYIGHPYSGAAYYVVARHAGLTKMQSFGYSVFMSTVFWEYGFEAAAEIPSIQDLIITPVIGSLMGEAFVQMSEKIVKNGGKLFGSKTAGSVALALMDPAGAILNSINKMFENNYIKDARTFIYTTPPNQYETNGTIGIGLELKF